MSYFPKKEKEMVELVKRIYGDKYETRKPNEKQWEMILSETKVTKVGAPAGSGKSTTLALRIMYLNLIHQVPLSEISVVSFTNNSVNEFVKNIYKLYSKAGKRVDKSFLEKNIRTFHSHAYHLSNSKREAIDCVDSIPKVKVDVLIGEAEEELAHPKKRKQAQTEFSHDKTYNFNWETRCSLQKYYRDLYLKNSEFQDIVDTLNKKTLRFLNWDLSVSREFFKIFNEVKVSRQLLFRSLNNDDRNNKQYIDWKSNRASNSKNQVNEFVNLIDSDQEQYIDSKVSNVYQVLFMDPCKGKKYYPSDRDITEALTELFLEQNPILKESIDPTGFHCHKEQNGNWIFNSGANLYYYCPTESKKQVGNTWIEERDTTYETRFYTNRIKGFESIKGIILIPLVNKETDKKVKKIIQLKYGNPNLQVEFKLENYLVQKISAISSYFQLKANLIRNENELLKIDKEQDNQKVPTPFLKLIGEKHWDNLYELMFKVADFSMQVKSTSQLLADHYAEVKVHYDKRLGTELSDYFFKKNWPTEIESLVAKGACLFEDYIKKQGFDFSNSIFCNKEFDRSRLMQYRHILIDEFQDVAPLQAEWVKNVSNKFSEEYDTDSTLMVVGDDWQSIYAFRGSDPRIFINFKNNFGEHGAIELQENYRSREAILSAANKLIEQVKSRQIKFPISTNSEKALVKIFKAKTRPDELGTVGELKSFIENLKIDNDSNISIFFLARNSYELKDLDYNNLLGDRKDFDILPNTIHKSKGLEANIVFILGDWGEIDSTPWKNLAYKLAANGTSDSISSEDNFIYDDIQRDEELRIAYVAITRAKDAVIWKGEFDTKSRLEKSPLTIFYEIINPGAAGKKKAA